MIEYVFTMFYMVYFFWVLFEMVSIRMPSDGVQLCLQDAKMENRILDLRFWEFVWNIFWTLDNLKCRMFMKWWCSHDVYIAFWLRQNLKDDTNDIGPGGRPKK